MYRYLHSVHQAIIINIMFKFPLNSVCVWVGEWGVGVGGGGGVHAGMSGFDMKLRSK